MRAAAIFGLGCSPNSLKPFQDAESSENDWRIGLPATHDEADAILLFGGDGTIHRHLGPLVKLGLPVLIVPTGSGNDFARALGLRSLRDSLAAWRGYRAHGSNLRRVDLGLITPLQRMPEATVAREAAAAHGPARNSAPSTRYFCSVAGVGLDAEVARRANALPRWLRGHGGYALSLAPAMFQFAAFPMKVFTPAQGVPGDVPKKDQPTILAAFANTSTYGGGMKIAPRAKPDDGLLDVCVVGAIDPFKLACLFPTIYFGRHLSAREVDYFSAAHLRVETEHPLDVYADGEYVCRTPVEVSVQQGALQVICPASKSDSWKGSSRSRGDLS